MSQHLCTSFAALCVDNNQLLLPWFNTSNRPRLLSRTPRIRLTLETISVTQKSFILQSYQFQGLFFHDGPARSSDLSSFRMESPIHHIHTSHPPNVKVHHPPSGAFNVLLTHSRHGTTPPKSHCIHTKFCYQTTQKQFFLGPPDPTGLYIKIPNIIVHLPSQQDFSHKNPPASAGL